MRDIREDLKERIQSAEANREEALRRVKNLEHQISTLKSLLEAESGRWPEPEGCAELHAQAASSAQSLNDVILDVMNDGGEWSAETIARYAVRRGHDFGKTKPGRSIHFKMIAMERRGLVEKLGFGRWKLKKPKEEEVKAEDAA